MRRAFSELYFDENDEKDIMNQFLEHGILKENGWEKCQIQIGTGKKKQFSDLDALFLESGIKKYAELDESRMLSAEEIKLKQISSVKGRF
jgi:hypothetical protein